MSNLCRPLPTTSTPCHTMPDDRLRRAGSYPWQMAICCQPDSSYGPGLVISEVPTTMLRLYDSPVSGNCYKARLLLAQLGREYERVELDLFASGARTPAFLAKNPHGRLPLLELEDGQCVAESNAILYYLARGTQYLPDDPVAAAQVLRWMFWEQNTLEPPLAGARFLLQFNGKTLENESVIKRRERAERALMQMEIHLGVRAYFVGDRYTIADTCLYAYTHCAPEAEISLDGYPAIQAWLERVEAQPGFIPMKPQGPAE